MRIQAIDNDSFFWFCRILLHILPRIKIRVNESVSPSDLELIKGGVAERVDSISICKHLTGISLKKNYTKSSKLTPISLWASPVTGCEKC